MHYLTGKKQEIGMKYLEQARLVALEATCCRSRCGCIIVKNKEIIGKGYNSPPKNLEQQRRCSNNKATYHTKVTDKTCCIHAEQRAIIDALAQNPHKLQDSQLYFIRLDNEGNMSEAGTPYCTICSKMALDVGIKEFILLHKEGIGIYDTTEYNTISFSYSE